MLANRTTYTVIWYTFYDLRPGNGVGLILTAPEPTWGTQQHSQYNVSLSRRLMYKDRDHIHG